MKGEGAEGRLGGEKSNQRNNFGPPWKSRRRPRGRGLVGRMRYSRIQIIEGGRVGKSAYWDGDKRRPGGKITSCGRRRGWFGDEVCPGRRMNLCGIYGVD